MKVGVTGVSGFVGSHCVRELLDHGHSVRGTVRDLSHPRAARLNQQEGLTLVEADLTRDDGWEHALEGCEAVLHTASPLALTEQVDTLVRPAVDGTLRVLRAAVSCGVQRVVLTSSTAAIIHTQAEIYTEEHWSEPDQCTPYPLSKTLAERAAWDFVAAHPALELVVCNPCLILGPLLTDRPSLSHSLVKRLLSRSMPALPRLGFSVVDVRDVASAHRLALSAPHAAGNRYLLMSEHLWTRDVSEILIEAFGDQGYRPPTLHLPYPLLWLLGRFDPVVRAILPDIDQHTHLDGAKARRELGWSPRSARASIIDTGQSLIDRGIV